jgi:hypothetical protein
MQQVLVTAVTEFRQRPLTVVSVRTELPWMYPNRDEVRGSVCWWCRRLTVSIPGSCYSFAARKVRGWLEPPARPSLTPQGTSTVYIRSHKQQHLLTSNIPVEDYSSGYPRFSALVGTHSAFYVCRRFSTLRARLLLQKQDRIAELEQQLQHIDEEELQPLFLGSLRRDRNQGRERVLAHIDVALQDYGEAVT